MKIVNLSVGQKARRSLTLTADQVKGYAELSGDTISAEAEVLKVHERKPVTQLKIIVTRQTGETVLDGEAWCYTFWPDD